MSADIITPIADAEILPDSHDGYDPTQSELPAIRESQAEVAIIPSSADTSVVADPYIGVAAVPFDDRAQAVLAKYQIVPDDWIDIKPNGQIYLSHMRLRAIFNEAFGYGGWGMVPVGPLHVERVAKPSKYANQPDYEHVTVYREYRLYVQGRFVRQMMGAGDYYTNNAETNYADAVESSESYALNRSGKPFGIASQCWDKAYGEEWKRKYARNEGGKWKKRTDIVTKTDAGSVSGDHAPQASASQPPASHPPTQQRVAADPTHADAPASGDGGSATIHVASMDPARKLTAAKGGVQSRGKSTDGRTWSFQSKPVIDAAEKAWAAGLPLLIRYEVNKGYLNVTDAEVVE